MGGRRNRSRGESSSRRRILRLLGGSLIGSGLLTASGSGAFGQTALDRTTSVDATEGTNAVLGLSITASVQAGVDGQQLVELTNNSAAPFDVTLSLADSTQGNLSRTSVSLPSGSTASVSISVARDSATGSDALTFDILGTRDDTVTVSATRSVDVTAPPELDQQIIDESANNNAAFTISYHVRRVSNFDRVGIEVENLDAGHIGTESYTRQTEEDTVSYPPGGGNDGGAAGDTYEFRFRVYDQSGELTDLYTVETTTANGQDPPGDDLGDSDDPSLVGFSVTNDAQNTNNRFTVDYEVDNTDEFQGVQVTFDNTANDWSDQTKTSVDAPTGTVVYPAEGQRQGGVDGDDYDVTVEVYNQSGIPVDSDTVTIQAGSNGTVQWP